MSDTVLFMNLIRSRLCNATCIPPVSGSISSDIVSHFMLLAKKHDLIPLIGSQLLEESTSLSQEEKDGIREAVCACICHYERMNYDLQWLADILEEGGIPHIPLKGSVMRNYYCDPWLRTCADIDILIPEQMLESATTLLCKKGCMQEAGRRYHDVPLRTPGGNTLELHFSIKEDIPAMDQTLSRVWDYCELVPGKQFQYRQSTEFLLFHLLAHMSYHLIHGGCGIRSFLDIWLLRQNEHIYDGILQALLSQSQLSEFYKNVVALTQVWFEDKAHNESTLVLQEMVLNSSTFGTRDNEILMEQAQAGSRAKYTLYRIFMPRKLLAKQFPILVNHPVLLPFCQFLRWIRILCNNRCVAWKEIRSSRSHSSAQVCKTKQALSQIGIPF